MKRLIGLLLFVASVATSAAGNAMLTGSGKFSVTGAAGYAEKEILVHYHVPKSINVNSRVLIVVPGAGRNGDSYRDSWIKASEKFNVVILSPSYSEEKYPGFWNYNIGGMLSDVKASKAKGVESFKIVKNPKEWIYNDFDEIFEAAKARFNLTTGKYDMFGHSAGGQVLHRLALFDVENKANVIIAANSGWYTVPDDDQTFPYGVGDLGFTNDFYRSAFGKKLVVFLGEKDDENERRGDLTRSVEIDRQGTHRLARGKNFFNNAQRFARNMGAKLNWSIEIIAGVGHDKNLMGEAAAEYLYRGK